MSESMAICEYFEEVYAHLPNKALPADPVKRFQVRRLCEQINAGTQPLANLGILNEIESRFGKEHRNPWGKHIDEKGMKVFETLLAQSAGKFCVGDEITLADMFLLPQLYRCSRFEIDQTAWPLVNEISIRLGELDFVKKSHCDAQPDAVL